MGTLLALTDFPVEQPCQEDKGIMSAAVVKETSSNIVTLAAEYASLAKLPRRMRGVRLREIVFELPEEDLDDLSEHVSDIVGADPSILFNTWIGWINGEKKKGSEKNLSFHLVQRIQRSRVVSCTES